MRKQFINGYALLIGVNDNINPTWALPDVEKDVKALHNVLINPERCAYPPEHVKVILRKDATRQNILEEIDRLKDKIDKDTSGNATAVVFYSGHGYTDEGQPPNYYLIPYDIKVDAYKSSALRAEDFAEAINSLKPKRLFVVLDCCRSGGMGVKSINGIKDVKGIPVYSQSAVSVHLFAPGAKTVSPKEGVKGLELLNQGSGRAVLSSSQGDQNSYLRKDGTMSIFTYHLIEAITGHAQPEEGAKEVLVSDVMSYVWRKVPASAKAEYNEMQEPDYQVSGNFPIALLLGGRGITKGLSAPDPLTSVERKIAISNNQINTGGGAYIRGNVKIEGGDFIGRDKIIRGDEIHGDKISGDKISVGNISGKDIAFGKGSKIIHKRVGKQIKQSGGKNIHGNQIQVAGNGQASINTGIGGENVRIDSVTIYQGTKPSIEKGETGEQHEHAIEEKLRLDVASPRRALVNEPFDVVIAVRQPDAPLLKVVDLDQVVSENGSIFRTQGSEIIKYRIEVIGAGFQITPKSYLLKLSPKTNSQPIAFQVIGKKTGKRSLFVTAYQQDGTLAVQTRINIKVNVAVLK
jgi:uncharacterized caspase-like protein